MTVIGCVLKLLVMLSVIFSFLQCFDTVG